MPVTIGVFVKLTGVIVIGRKFKQCNCKIESRVREIVKQASVDCTVIAVVIAKRKDNRCFWKFTAVELEFSSKRGILAAPTAPHSNGIFCRARTK